MNIVKGTGGMAPDPEAEVKTKKNNLLTRVISAVVMLPIAVYVIMSGGLPFFLLVGLLTVFILSEWNGIVEKKPLSILFVVESFCAILLLLALNWGSPFLVYSFICSIVSVLTVAYLVKANILWTIIGFLYALLPSASFLMINENYGGVVILWMMILIWSMDTGAYFVGKNIGGPKMSPKISPNKTWSGLFGGTVIAMIMGSLFGLYMKNTDTVLFNNATILIILSGLLALLSQVGDLAESAVKRAFNVKDSGTIIPGHGGVMDRIDGVLFVAPAVLVLAYVIYAR